MFSFSGFTQKANSVLNLTIEFAQELGHTYIGSEHLLAGILKEGESKDVFINITSLSSGEKQLFILLTEALLQRGIPHLFIADEPELSLHIEWQRKILNALLDLNPNAQIIVATHSPEIAGNFAENIVNMKKITSYE